MATFRAYAAKSAKSALEPFEYDPGPLSGNRVEVKVRYCGVCHSDLSMLDNEWGFSQYPFVPGHEVVGEVVAVGDGVTTLSVGDRVGIGWYTASCMVCSQCLSGDHNLCPRTEQTIVGRHGGFADRIRCDASWAVRIPTPISDASCGPLFCGGITVFNPILQFGIRPTDRVGVIGIGGLGHLALQFLNKWGCHVTAFTSSATKADEAKRLGARDVVDSRSADALGKTEGSFDFILSTVNAPLDWQAYLAALRPKGRLHLVGAVLEPLRIPVFSLLGGQKSVSASPLGSPAAVETMLEFCARHEIAPVVEPYPMSEVNAALEHLRAGKARYRIVLKNDF